MANWNDKLMRGWMEDQDDDDIDEARRSQLQKMLNEHVTQAAKVGALVAQYVMGEEWDKSRKKKISASHKIADALSKISTNFEASAKLLKLMTEQELQRSKIPTAVELMTELHCMPEVKSDRDLLYRCTILLDSASFREIFVQFKDDREELVGWLRFCAYIPNAFGKRLPP